MKERIKVSDEERERMRVKVNERANDKNSA